MSTLEDLLERVQAATEPSRSLDADITETLTPARVEGWKRDGDAWLSRPGNRIREPFHYTRSIDYAAQLVAQLLPEAKWDTSNHKGFDASVCAAIVWSPASVDGEGATPALALLAALLKTLIRAQA